MCAVHNNAEDWIVRRESDGATVVLLAAIQSHWNLLEQAVCSQVPSLVLHVNTCNCISQLLLYIPCFNYDIIIF